MITGFTATKTLEQAIAEAASRSSERVEHPQGKNCVALVLWMVPSLAGKLTGDWKPGVQITQDGRPNIAPGTAIATFDENGKYRSKTGDSHAAVFKKYDVQNGQEGIVVRDQASNYEPRETFIPFSRPRGQRGYTANQFYVIK